MRKVLLLLAIIAIGKGNIILGNDGPVVETKDGIIIGTYGVTEMNQTYASFQGIRYGEPMTGEKRFRDPIPASRLSVINATQSAPICMQMAGGLIIGEEDCLFLNVHVPTNIPRRKKGIPVVVHVDGGNFYSVSSYIYNYDLFLEYKAIFVAFAYRVGALGFLCLHNEDVPGNAGLKDQVLALKWVKKHIEYFGGDPNKISIYGGSAGAASVHLQKISSMSKGLFNSAMSSSGGGLNSWVIQRKPLEIARRMAVILGINSNSSDFLAQLQQEDSGNIIVASRQVERLIPTSPQQLTFSPVVEKKFPKKEAFLSKTPYEHYKTGDYSHVPTIVGASSKEGLLLLYAVGNATFIGWVNNPKIVVPDTWQRVLGPEGTQRVYHHIMEFFFREKPFNFSQRDHFETAINIIGDIYVFKGIDDTARALAETSKAPIYCYTLSTTAEFGGFLFTPLGLLGAGHDYSLLYFTPVERPRLNPYLIDGWARRRLMAFYLNLIEKGDPTPGKCTNLLPTKWLPMTKEVENYMEINQGVTPSVKTAHCRMKFWTETEHKVFSGVFKSL